MRSMVSAQSPLAFIYDRHATNNTVILDLRLKACAKYVSSKGWGFGGWWLDKGDDALTDDNRPAFDALLRTMQAAPIDTPRVCLIYDWHRFSRDLKISGLMTRCVLMLNGECWVETCDGETRTSGGRYRQVGRLTSGPVTG